MTATATCALAEQHEAWSKVGWHPWRPRHCESCGACESVTGFVFAGCVKCGGTGGADHPGHGPSGPVGEMRGPILCRDCFHSWLEERGFNARQQGLGL